MFRIAKPLYMVCETPLHAGSGSDLGIVDLPIQRERHTGFPKVEGSSLKGSLKEVFENLKEVQIADAKIDAVEGVKFAFGPEDGNAHAGALSFTDARLLLFPVKSMKGVYGWITCPKVLERFVNDLSLCGIQDAFKVPVESSAPVESELFIKDDLIILEEYTFKINKDDICRKLGEWLSENVIPQQPDYKYWRDKVQKDIVVLSDDAFRDFVNLSTEVITRTKIDNTTGTVKDGALFTEEYLPSESVLYSIIMAAPIFSENKGSFQASNAEAEAAKVLAYFEAGLPKVIQLGGNATLGKGLIRTYISAHEKKEG